MRIINLARNLFRAFALLRYPETQHVLVHHLEKRRVQQEVLRLFPKAKVDVDVEWIAFSNQRLSLGFGAVISKGTVMAFGDGLNGYGRISVGRGTWIGQYNNLRASGYAPIVIGDDCLISQFCSLIGSNHSIGIQAPMIQQPPNPERLGVTIGNDVWLGAGVSVMPGTKIDEGSVVGANSVVTRSIPAYEIWAGCPARKIGVRS